MAEPSIDDCLHGIAELKTQNNLILRLLNGEPDQDILGIRPRLTRVENRIDMLPPMLVTEWAEMRTSIKGLQEKITGYEQRLLGAKWVLGALGITTGALGAAVVRLLWGIH